MNVSNCHSEQQKSFEKSDDFFIDSLKKMGRKPIEIDLKKVEEYAQVCDSEEEIARALGISQATLTRRKQDSDDFAEAIKKGRAKANIFVGGKLMEKIKDGDTASIIFYLKTRAGWKETNRTELTGANGGAVKVENAIDLSGVSLENLKAAKALLNVKDE